MSDTCSFPWKLENKEVRTQSSLRPTHLLKAYYVPALGQRLCLPRSYWRGLERGRGHGSRGRVRPGLGVETPCAAGLALWRVGLCSVATAAEGLRLGGGGGAHGWPGDTGQQSGESWNVPSSSARTSHCHCGQLCRTPASGYVNTAVSKDQSILHTALCLATQAGRMLQHHRAGPLAALETCPLFVPIGSADILQKRESPVLPWAWPFPSSSLPVLLRGPLPSRQGDPGLLRPLSPGSLATCRPPQVSSRHLLHPSLVSGTC